MNDSWQEAWEPKVDIVHERKLDAELSALYYETRSRTANSWAKRLTATQYTLTSSGIAGLATVFGDVVKLAPAGLAVGLTGIAVGALSLLRGDTDRVKAFSAAAGKWREQLKHWEFRWRQIEASKDVPDDVIEQLLIADDQIDHILDEYGDDLRARTNCQLDVLQRHELRVPDSVRADAKRLKLRHPALELPELPEMHTKDEPIEQSPTEG